MQAAQCIWAKIKHAHSFYLNRWLWPISSCNVWLIFSHCFTRCKNIFQIELLHVYFIAKATAHKLYGHNETLNQIVKWLDVLLTIPIFRFFICNLHQLTDPRANVERIIKMFQRVINGPCFKYLKHQLSLHLPIGCNYLKNKSNSSVASK